VKPELAQSLPLSFSGQFWAIPGNRFICVVSLEIDGSVGQACATVKKAIRRGISLITIDGGAQRTIVGIAPDGSRGVSVFTGGEVETVRIVNGVFAVRDSNSSPPDIVKPF
jgi:hypothetical protein